MSFRIQSGPAAILASGQATTFAGHPLLLAVRHGLPIEVELRFAVEPEAGPRVELLTQTDVRLVYLLVNFDGPDGRGSAEPVLLGEVEDELVFFHFRVFRYGNTPDRTVHYTFYVVKKESIGWVSLRPEAG